MGDAECQSVGRRAIVKDLENNYGAIISESERLRVLTVLRNEICEMKFDCAPPTSTPAYRRVNDDRSFSL